MASVYQIYDEESGLLDDAIFLHEMPDLTNQECDLGNLAHALTCIICDAAADKLHNLDGNRFAWIEWWLNHEQRLFSSVLGDRRNFSLPIAQGFNAPDWYYYHWTYITLDGLQMIRLTFQMAETIYEPKVRSRLAWFQGIKQKIDQKRLDLFDSLQRAIKKIRIPLEQRESVKELIRAGIGCEEDTEDAVGQELRLSPTSRDLMEHLAVRMLASWRVGLDNARKLLDKELHL